jgi:hypothetical protein
MRARVLGSAVVIGLSFLCMFGANAGGAELQREVVSASEDSDGWFASQESACNMAKTRCSNELHVRCDRQLGTIRRGSDDYRSCYCEDRGRGSNREYRCGRQCTATCEKR